MTLAMTLPVLDAVRSQPTASSYCLRAISMAPTAAWAVASPLLARMPMSVSGVNSKCGACPAVLSDRDVTVVR